MAESLAAHLFSTEATTQMRTGRLIMGTLYIGAGTLHFIATRTYTGIMPSYLPAHRELVYLSGGAEILGGIGVLIRQTRQPAAWGIILLLVAVFPANITMITEHSRFPEVPFWAAWLRLPLQLPLIYWAWLYTRPEGSHQQAEGA